MSDKNLVYLVGRLGRDPEVRTTQSGRRVVNLSVATSERGRDGEERTSWHKAVAWQQLADQCDGVRKGQRIGVVGSLRTRSYEPRDGGKRWITEVVADVLLLEPQRQQTLAPQHTVTEEQPFDSGDDLPF